MIHLNQLCSTEVRYVGRYTNKLEHSHVDPALLTNHLVVHKLRSVQMLLQSGVKSANIWYR